MQMFRNPKLCITQFAFRWHHEDTKQQVLSQHIIGLYLALREGECIPISLPAIHDIQKRCVSRTVHLALPWKLRVIAVVQIIS